MSCSPARSSGSRQRPPAQREAPRAVVVRVVHELRARRLEVGPGGQGVSERPIDEVDARVLADPKRAAVPDLRVFAWIPGRAYAAAPNPTPSASIANEISKLAAD